MPEIKNYYNTERDITPHDLPKLPMSVKIDFIGKNDIPVFGQFIDFERPVYNIRQDVAELDFLMHAYEDDKYCSFLICNEPDRTAYPKSHEAWTDLRKWNKTINIPLEDTEKVKEYAEIHAVQPWFN